MSAWQICKLKNETRLIAELDALYLSGVKGVLSNSPADFSDAETRLERLLPTLIPQLVEQDLAVFISDDALKIEYDDFAAFEANSIDGFSSLLPPSPFALEIRSQSALGMPRYRYLYNFYLDARRAAPERRGSILRYDNRFYRLDTETFLLLETIDNFNNAPEDAKLSGDAYLKFAEVKGLANGIGANLDRYLSSRRVIVPSQIGVDLIVEDNDRISFAPKVEGAPPEAFWSAFKLSGAIHEVYEVKSVDGEKLSVVLSDEQREVLRRIQRVRHLSGADKTKVLRDPQAVFDGVMQTVNLDGFGPRVRGIGDFPFAVQPFVQPSVTGIFDDKAKFLGLGATPKFNAGLLCRYADGAEENIIFASSTEVTDFYQKTLAAYRTGIGQIEHAGKSIALDQSFVESLGELVKQVAPRSVSVESPEQPQKKGRYLLIYTNEESIEYTADEQNVELTTTLELPSSLKQGVKLKEHQKKGVTWLQHNFRLNRQGCLLADDMGLGKTLQVLTFLAWLIEQNQITGNDNAPECPPWNPILIVAPVILIENETWIADMKKFFSGDGAIFLPWLTLRGAELKAMKRATGQETQIGESILDLDRLRQNRVVLTNYETVVNYQHSFAKMREHWSVVVTDEAQEYKTPNTKISHALKCLSPRFRVACTGTPVETRLLDVWNIFDFLQPGKLLGSATEFRSEFEKPLEAVDETQAAVKKLKDRLQFGQANAFVLRRDKCDLPDLPAKYEHRLECALSSEQRQCHIELLQRAAIGGKENHPLGLIHYFLRVYQHPALVPQFEPRTATQAIEECDKLQSLLGALHKIKRLGEKALIFTRTLDMQQLLVTVLNHEFDMNTGIINGSTARSNSNNTSKSSGGDKTRRGIVNRFRETGGFDVLILSPDVAGMGLTLIEANHVFHYGRWWNPAKEAQATDRVYRIGQEKDVHIYYLIAKDFHQEFQTFDEKLDALLIKRQRLADDFLSPMPNDENLEREFLGEIFKGFG